jgi:hypothetical protein
MTGRIRRRDLPTRPLGQRVIVARPADGAPVVLATTAAVVWNALSEWTTVDGLDAELAATYPDVPQRTRREALDEILRTFEVDDLVAHG